MSVEQILILLVIGILAGFINIVAGGGSLITLPFLIIFGLPASVANGTNRIAILFQNIVAISNFRKNGYFEWKFSILLAIPAVIGSIIGAQFAIDLPDSLYNRILSVIMIMVILIMIFQPHKKIRTTNGKQTPLRIAVTIIVFFLIGGYGGFIQAGVGFLIIASLLATTGMSLVKISSIKVFIIGSFLISSLIVFIINGQVNWGYGLTLAIGTGIGAFIGSHLVVTKGEKWVRIAMIVAVTAMAIKLWLDN